MREERRGEERRGEEKRKRKERERYRVGCVSKLVEEARKLFNHLPPDFMQVWTDLNTVGIDACLDGSLNAQRAHTRAEVNEAFSIVANVELPEDLADQAGTELTVR